MLIISANVMARDILTEAIIMGDFSCLDDVIDIEDIRHFSKHDLRILRNTFFAKNGYIFISDDLKKHFSKFPWYNDEVNLKKELTRTDWVNIALIQSLEKNTGTDFQEDNDFGEHFLSDKLYGLDNGTRVETIQFDGEITAAFDLWMFEGYTELARAKIINNEFHLDLAEIPLNLLEHWERRFDEGWLYCSDPETKTGFLSLEITGTMTNILDGRKQTLSPRTELNETKGVYYIYSDRDAIIRGVTDGELYTPGAYHKIVWNLVLKKGWNKVKGAHKTYTGKYNTLMTETTSEKGDFGIEIDYFKEEPKHTIYGKIGLDTHPEFPEYYVLLKQPIRATMNDYEAEPPFHKNKNVHKLVLFLDENIDKTFSSKNDYIIHGSLSPRLLKYRGEYEISFHAMEVEIEEPSISNWLTKTSLVYKYQTAPYVLFIFPVFIIGICIFLIIAENQKGEKEELEIINIKDALKIWKESKFNPNHGTKGTYY